MNLNDFLYEYDGRRYFDPNVLLADQNAFIDNYRNLQAQNNAQIAQQTRALGTQVPSQLGGLTGGGSYFKSRYQTPQTNQAIAELRTAAQAQALQQALQNELEKAKKKYKDAQNNLTTKGSGGLSGLETRTRDSGAGDPQQSRFKERIDDTSEPLPDTDLLSWMESPTGANLALTALQYNPAFMGVPSLLTAIGRNVLGLKGWNSYVPNFATPLIDNTGEYLKENQ